MDKITIIEASARLNKKSLEPLAMAASLARVKRRLVDDLVRQITSGGLITLTSSTNPKNGATTFVASLQVVPKSTPSKEETFYDEAIAA